MSDDLNLVLQLPTTLVIRGQVSGRLYTFKGAGDSQPVDIRDAPKLLKLKKKPGSCCGGAGVPSISIFKEE